MTGSDTSVGGGRAEFPSTVWDDLRRAGDPDAFNELVKAYWRPVYHYVRFARKKPHEDAKDLTQEFFATIFAPAFIARSDPERGSFRSFVLSSLRNFLANEERDRM